MLTKSRYLDPNATCWITGSSKACLPFKDPCSTDQFRLDDRFLTQFNRIWFSFERKIIFALFFAGPLV